MKTLQVLDRLIPYDAFLNDLAARIVERWRRQGKVEFYKRPGKVEYKTSDLRLLQRTVQDYLESPLHKEDDSGKKKN